MHGVARLWTQTYGGKKGPQGGVGGTSFAATRGRESVPSASRRAASRVGRPSRKMVMAWVMWPQFTRLVTAPPPVATRQFRNGASSCGRVQSHPPARLPDNSRSAGTNAHESGEQRAGVEGPQCCFGVGVATAGAQAKARARLAGTPTTTCTSSAGTALGGLEIYGIFAVRSLLSTFPGGAVLFQTAMQDCSLPWSLHRVGPCSGACAHARASA